MTEFTLYNMDCRDAMGLFIEPNSVDSVVTDPPYGLGFMGKEWDHGVPGVEFWQAAYDALKPGGHLLAFSGSRTYHRMVCAIEDAGFDIRDQIMWVYGSGFPKSHNLTGANVGWGTALKPAHEPICVARKPFAKGSTVAENVLLHGTGALNIDASRVAVDPSDPNHRPNPSLSNEGANSMFGSGGHAGDTLSAAGRWPANLIHDGSPEVLGAFPDAKGQQGDLVGHSKVRGNGIYGDMAPAHDAIARTEIDKSAARFFYCAKASKKDRDEGLDALPTRIIGMSGAAAAAAARGEHYDNGDGGVNQTKERKNHHPTVKPTDLMQYLCRLVTPPGGTVFDPFMGSGSTGKAAMREGFKFIGCELDADYVAIAQARISAEVSK